MDNNPASQSQLPPQPPPGLPNQLALQQLQSPCEPTADERTLAMLIHLLSILTGFVGPLILWLVKKNESAYIDHHGKESVNFNLSFLLYGFILMAMTLVITFVTFGFGMVLLFPLFFAYGIAFLIIEILACVAANNGQWHRVPLTIRFIS